MITHSVYTNWDLNRYLVMGALLGLVLYGGLGGVKRVAKICTWMMPLFMAAYLGMAFWVIGHQVTALPAVLVTVFKTAFSGHAAIGGFAGSSIILAIQHGMARAAYSGDIGIGYDSIIQCESSTVFPEKQARLSILGVFIDNLICTVSILLVLIAGVWSEPIQGSHLVQVALSRYFPGMQIFMPLFLILCGYTTLIAFFVVGLKCARYLAPRRGTLFYCLYGVTALIFFSFADQTKALLVMSLAGAILLILNLIGIFRLRHEISYTLTEDTDYQEVKETS